MMRYQSKKFVIQEHKKEGDVHWDLMLENDGFLETYRLDVPPEEISSRPANAQKIFDHPTKFLTYEGSVNEGKGSVKIAETGTYRIVKETDETIEINIDGKLLNGKFELRRCENNVLQFGVSCFFEKD
jgi:DNA polymerase Ligase (LigD)